MAKASPRRRDLVREQLVYHIARVMVEEGVDDYALAKRKGMRRMGMGDATHHLPSNEEIDAAVQSYRALYQQDSHPGVLRSLREQALTAMRMLEPFHPYLTGPVLSGTAGEQSDIKLVVFSDDEKAVVLYLLRHGVEFEEGGGKGHGKEASVPVYTLTGEFGTPIHIAVLQENVRHAGSRHPETHADIAAVETLLRA